MQGPTFQFKLRPVEQVQPWGGPTDPNLHWFGLTDGEYWIQAGDHRLFEYSDAAQTRFGVSRFCDYQVVRLLEDVLDLAPYALEPIPEELRRYIALDESSGWDHFWPKWCATIDERDSSEEVLGLLDDAGSWLGRRKLDSGYLTPSTNVVMWSDSNSVHIQWDNRGKFLDGCQTWSAQFGAWNIPRAAFKAEVLGFHGRLVEQMAQRVVQVAQGALAEHIRVDIEGLRREQQVRERSIDRALELPAPPTDWSAVAAAIRELEARSAGVSSHALVRGAVP